MEEWLLPLRQLSEITTSNGAEGVNEPAIEQVLVLADISRSRYVVIAMKSVLHQLQMRPVVNN